MRRHLSGIALVLALASCGGGEGEPAGAPSTASAPTPSTTAALGDTEGEFGAAVKVSARANIFGAGRDQPPSPGHGGAGVLPSVWELPDGSKRTVTFPMTSGRLNPVSMYDYWNGPEGAHRGTTDITSYKGIAGIVDHGNTMFLVGVFLTDAEPSGKAPPRLDFSKKGERFKTLAPNIGQTFFIGGGKGRTYRVPRAATRLFVGFADAFAFGGEPGWYGNNSGDATVVAEITVD